MESNVTGADAFRKRSENVQLSRELQSRIDSICDNAMLVFELPEATFVKDWGDVFVNYALLHAESESVSDLFLSGAQEFAGLFMDHLENPTALEKTSLTNLNDPEHVRSQAVNAWLKYVTWQASERSAMDALYLRQFAFKAFGLWVTLTVEKGPENLGLLHAFDASTETAIELYGDFHSRDFSVA